MSSPISSPIKMSSVSLVGLVLVVLMAVGHFASVESKFLRPAPFMHEPGLYPEESVRTGERAIVTVRGARNTMSGLPPRRLALEASPYRGDYPRRGIYDNLGPSRWEGMGWPSDLVPLNGGYDSMAMDRYRMNHFGRPSFYPDEAPARVAVTGAYPTGGYRNLF